MMYNMKKNCFINYLMGLHLLLVVDVPEGVQHVSGT